MPRRSRAPAPVADVVSPLVEQESWPRLPQRKWKRGGVIREFTRHPKALARVESLPLQAGAQRTLFVLVKFADKDGSVCISPREIARLTPVSERTTSYSVAHIIRGLKKLKEDGFVDWDRVPALGHFPTGRFTQSGGRVFWVNLLALQRRGPLWSRDNPRKPSPPEAPPSPQQGHDSVSPPPIMVDPGTPITRDPPSDPLCLPPEDKMDHAAADSAAARASPAKAASETPSGADGTMAQHSVRGAAMPRVTRESFEGGQGTRAPPDAPASREELRALEQEWARWGYKPASTLARSSSSPATSRDGGVSASSTHADCAAKTRSTSRSLSRPPSTMSQYLGRVFSERLK
jgi:hypothetical protein